MNKIKDLNLHDYEISDILCDYINQKVEIPIQLSNHQNKNKKAVLIFENVQYLDISLYEPWGAGIYINEVNVNDGTDIINRLNKYQFNKEYFCISFLLNSGDKINVLALKMTYLDK